MCYKIKNKIYEQPLNLLGLNKWISAPFKDSEIKQMRLSVAGCTPSGIANVQHFKYKTNDFKNIMKFVVVGLGSIGKDMLESN